MNEPIKKFMKIGTIHFMSYPECIKGEGPVLETLKKIAVDDYFDAVELTWIRDADVRRQAIELLAASGLTVCYGSQPRHLTTGLNINHLDEAQRQAALASLKEGIDEAYEWKASGFAYLSGKYEQSSKEESYQKLLQSTKEMCAYAKEKGNMRIVLEIFDYDVDKKSIIGPAALAKRFAEDVLGEYDNFGLLVDLSHIPQTHETIEEALLPIRDYIVHAHIGSCVLGDPSLPAYGDAHPRFDFPNSINGPREVAHFLKVLVDIGYFEKFDRPVVSFEIKPYGSEDRDVVLANCKRVLNEAWAML